MSGEVARLGVWSEKARKLLEEALRGNSARIYGELYFADDGEVCFKSQHWQDISPVKLKKKIIRRVGWHTRERRLMLIQEKNCSNSKEYIEGRETYIRDCDSVYQFMRGKVSHASVEKLVGKPLNPFMQAKLKALMELKEAAIEECLKETDAARIRRDVKLKEIEDELAKLL